MRRRQVSTDCGRSNGEELTDVTKTSQHRLRGSNYEELTDVTKTSQHRLRGSNYEELTDVTKTSREFVEITYSTVMIPYISAGVLAFITAMSISALAVVSHLSSAVITPVNMHVPATVS
ncbi:hypothetical protein PoB_007658700 [Plakobranchus ocellatus]|uniref:Uncharacterized protein n=1 Tax=Plakobranchus ocellatus TaxID=259542 RepID=A0AAV4E0I3_9GAST|nr:hypothetical protein PoB_007658700 [Plakobranchus ocellatus]